MNLSKDRLSGVELLRIIAMLLIIIFHVTYTLNAVPFFNNLHFYDGYYVAKPTTDMREFIMIIFANFGTFGNYIFIIITSYFMVNTKKHSEQKIVTLVVNTIVISIICLIVFLLCKVNIKGEHILMSIFPITFKNNWFITTYLIFMLSIPYLNIIIEKLNQRQLLRLAIGVFIINFIMAYFNYSFDITNVITFISIFFIMSYFKKYMENFWNDRKHSLVILIFGIVILTLFQFLMNYVGLVNKSLGYETLHSIIVNNPVIFITMVAVFYLFKQMTFKSKFINMLSSLSLYVYLIHENILFREYTRVYIWHYIYERTGHTRIIAEILIYALILFVLAFIISYIYKNTLAKVIDNKVEKVITNQKVKSILRNLEGRMLRID